MIYDLYSYKAHVIKVYDGDTITVNINLGFDMWMYNQKIRLLGINTPEIRGEDRLEGLISRDRLRDLILDKDVVIKTLKDKTGKYGRWLGTIYLKEELSDNWNNINQTLMEEGLAKAYGG